MTYSLGKCLNFEKGVYLFVAVDSFVRLSLYLISYHLTTLLLLLIFEMETERFPFSLFNLHTFSPLSLIHTPTHTHSHLTLRVHANLKRGTHIIHSFNTSESLLCCGIMLYLLSISKFGSVNINALILNIIH